MKIIKKSLEFRKLLKLAFLLGIILLNLGCASQSIISETPARATNTFRSTDVVTQNIKTNEVQKLIAAINHYSAHQKHLDIPFSKPTRARKTYSQQLSPGDKIEVIIPEGKEFSGVFTVEMDGSLRLPHLNAIDASGRSTQELADQVHERLVLDGIFRADFVQVSINAVQWAPVHIAIRGAVYNPGNILINQRNHKESFNTVTSRTGDFANKRLLSSALKAAGGLKPTADIKHIKLIRNNNTSELDMSGLLTGKPVIDPALTAGDQIVVPALSYIQESLLRPSTVTPPGFRVYLSNLTIPADSNNKSSNNKFASSLPPGSRLLTGAMSANCVGGTISVNSRRKILLAGKDPITNQIRVMERSLQELITNPNADTINPYLMPDDNIACYDSGMTNARDIARSVSDFLRPFAILSGAAL